MQPRCGEAAPRYMKRRIAHVRFMSSLMVLLAMGVAATLHAQGFPSKPVRIVVGFTPGGATDVVARTISQKLSEALGQAVVVDNRPGAASNIGAELVAKAPKDGHTLLLGTVSTSINPSLYKKLAYDPLVDFTAITQVTGTPFLFVAMFASMAQLNVVHAPYKGSASSTTAILSGESIFMFDNIVTTLPLAHA